jgi:hypothetical protein
MVGSFARGVGAVDDRDVAAVAAQPLAVVAVRCRRRRVAELYANGRCSGAPRESHRSSSGWAVDAHPVTAVRVMRELVQFGLEVTLRRPGEREGAGVLDASRGIPMTVRVAPFQLHDARG